MKDARLLRAAKVFGDDLQPTPRRRFGIARIERQNDRSLRTREHVDRKVLRECSLHKGNELLGEPAENNRRVRGRVDGRKFENERGDHDALGTHRRGEEGLLAWKMPQDGCSGDVQFAGDIRERRGLEPFARKDAPRRFKQPVSLDDRRAAHL